MIDQDGTQCDGCNKYETGKYLPFAGKIRRLKELGWQIVKTGQTWRHYCPTCKTKNKRPNKPLIKPTPAPHGTYWWQKD